jgi:acetylornithine deacetylase/succinyl-diaminopimelate desuccinylase-like protein
MTIPSFEPVIENARLYGRGSYYTKVGLAAMMHTLAEPQSSDQTAPCEVWAVATPTRSTLTEASLLVAM